jgi:uncharacterized caspase-like protein
MAPVAVRNRAWVVGMSLPKVSMFFMVAAALLASLVQAFAESPRRVALVIGNSAYEHTTPLANPRNDANDIAQALKSLGFEVVVGTDLDKSKMDRTIRTFAERLKGASLGVFFYAGHGLQVDQQNYLVPVDAKLVSSSAVDFELVRLDLVQRTMERESRVNVLFFDACRDNPLARSLARALGTRSAGIGRGLAAVESGEGTLIAFSTQPGNVALDGTGRNSPFAAAVVKHIGAPGEDISAVLINVRNDVMAATARRQVPWDHSALTARIYFGEPRAPSAPTLEQQAELALWNTIKDSADATMVRSYLERYPNGSFAPTAQILLDKILREAEQNATVQAREEELRKAEAARAAAETAKRESERQALIARQAEELKRTKDEARAAREALARAEKESAVAKKAADEARAAAEKAKAERENAGKQASQPATRGRTSGGSCFSFNGKTYCQ